LLKDRFLSVFQRCGKVLSCGHRCPSLCGEDCPESRFCHECGMAGRLQVVDMICFSTYQDHDVDDDPVIFLPCGHFFAVSTLDGCLEIDSVYATGEDGKTFTGIKGTLSVKNSNSVLTAELQFSLCVAMVVFYGSSSFGAWNGST
jgi:hypothetical protein